jgi:predicted RNA binding protein with dsRBD fold (UPF0201 family)
MQEVARRYPSEDYKDSLHNLSLVLEIERIVVSIRVYLNRLLQPQSSALYIHMACMQI